ncbi:putative rab GTPase activator [Dioszegia hungarica]|uniref:Rab GTPase activator n=1 Tax=Dioszegia hungarica TaxID=4972 RepID=A0AA38HF01_9TREE|nr:putative rab GTPase activator [Dioszegia hungarica]KAI9639156.1 putative rab GTPase activator [Dioszegia hungarica]
MSVIDPRELNDLAAFAGRGGLGYGVAMTDCVAEQPDQLMYLEGDSLVLLRDLGPILIASCEGVVGWVKKDHVRFDRLASSSSPTPSSPTSAPISRSESVTPHADLPRTVVHSPSPPMSTKNLPLPIDHDEQGRKLSLLAESMDEKDKRASNPFELDSPLGTPGVDSAEKRFEVPPTSAPAEEKRAMGAAEDEEEEWKRESMTSVDSSNFGGIGGVKITTPSSPPSTDDLSPTSATSASSQPQAQSPGAWDIYDSYSRESMYAKRASTRQSDTPSRTTVSSTTRLRIANPDSDDEGDGGEETGAEREASLPSATQSSDEHHTSIASIASTELITPNPPSEEMLQDVRVHTSPERIERNVPAPDTPDIKIRMDAEKQPLLDSPVPMDESPRAKGKVQPMVALALPSTDSSQTIALRSPPPPPGPPRRPSLAPSSSSPSVDNDTPLRRPSVPWNPNSPASPHSVDATRQAVEAVRKTPESKRSRGMTLVGRMEADLSQSRGPVPITFLIGDSGMPGSLAISPPMPSLSGLGFPISGPGSGHGMKKSGSMQSTLASPIMDIDDPALALKITPSAYPAMRSATNPLPPTTSEPSQTAGMPKPGFFPRPRSRSFSAAVSKVMAKKAGPGRGSSSNTSTSTGTSAGPTAATGPGKRPFFSRQSSLGATTSLAPSTSHPDQPPTPISPAISVSPEIMGFLNNDSSTSLPRPPPSARSSSFSFRYTSTIPSVPASGRPLPSPVSNKDYEDTVKADGLDFEIIQPRSKRNDSLLSPSSSSDEMLSASGGGAELERKGTVISSTSGRSLRTLPDTDEWGFIKDKSPTPEVFMGRAGGAGQRALEQKWLGIINTPLTSQAPKKVRKLAIESGIPASLRGRVWAWFMMPIMTARRPGLYQELLDHDREDRRLAERIDSDVAAAYPDHSIYSETSTGQTDLRQILRAYSHFATGGYRPEMSLIAGMLLIHCVAEDAFWLLSGFVNGSLRDYYASPTGQSGGKAVGMRVDAAVFAGVLAGSEPKLGKLFRDIGLHPIVFLEEWYAKLFLRCLPWPTALRIIDAVVAEGPRFLLIASLTILTLSRDRLLALPRTYTDVLAYLRDLPQDALLLPEGFMKACENVKFKEDDMKRMRAGVEKELGI